jgi:hypothetical protein
MRGGSRLAAAVLVLTGATLLSALQLPSEPFRGFGASITGAFEGWFDNPGGGRSFLVGYLNRNFSQAMNVPIGPENRIEPGGPDLGQPTHFLPGRQTGVFTVPVPKDFTSPDQRLIWTLVVNGQTTSIPLRLHPDYIVSPFTDVAVGNTPPILRFDPTGSAIQGPVAYLARAVPRTATLSAPLELPLWASDDAKYSSGSNAPQRNPPPPVILHWSLYRGPAAVTFDKASPDFEILTGGNAAFAGKATAIARFSAPGDYILHVTAEDYSGDGGGGEVCCWTNALVRVTVTR